MWANTGGRVHPSPPQRMYTLYAMQVWYKYTCMSIEQLQPSLFSPPVGTLPNFQCCLLKKHTLAGRTMLPTGTFLTFEVEL